jgi:Asp-tRNA(Asn)/Glu-tRNA(Gln) amidotransferase A subunit family amidase
MRLSYFERALTRAPFLLCLCFPFTGTDIGGSVRIPAHFSGNTALKPTARRLSLQGFRASVPGQEAIPAVAGPMAQRTEDLILLLRELWVQEAWDRDCDLVPVPFNEQECNNKGKLKVGYYIDDGFVSASPACQRAVLEAVEALRNDGHTVTEFNPPRVLDCIAMYYALITSDNATTLANQLNGEVWEDYAARLIQGVRLPSKMKQFVAYMLTRVWKEKKAAAITRASRERTVAELWALQSERKKLRQDWFDAWKSQGNFDVILTPVHVLPAVPHGSFKNISFTCSYTLLFNVLDLPAGVLPITTVDQQRDAYPAGSQPTSLLDKAARACYQLTEQHGLPLGVQVVGQPFKDETVLRAMSIIEGLVRFRQPKVQL